MHLANAITDRCAQSGTPAQSTIYMQSPVRIQSPAEHERDGGSRTYPNAVTAAQMMAAQSPVLSPMIVTSLSQTGHLPSLQSFITTWSARAGTLTCEVNTRLSTGIMGSVLGISNQ